MDRENLEKIKRLRHELHAHPELSMKERETKRRLMEFLRENTKLFIEDRGHYFYAYANGKNEELEPIAFRADMDALPMEEKAGLPYGSKIPASAISAAMTGTAPRSAAWRWKRTASARTGRCTLFFSTGRKSAAEERNAPG